MRSERTQSRHHLASTWTRSQLSGSSGDDIDMSCFCCARRTDRQSGMPLSIRATANKRLAINRPDDIAEGSGSSSSSLKCGMSPLHRAIHVATCMHLLALHLHIYLSNIQSENRPLREHAASYYRMPLLLYSAGSSKSNVYDHVTEIETDNRMQANIDRIDKN